MITRIPLRQVPMGHRITNVVTLTLWFNPLCGRFYMYLG
jgi:hypothetical protein